MKISNIKLKIAYDGTHYAGWQIQKNAKTIQGEIEKALKKILKKKVRLIAAGRTDSGVHAEAQVANFRAPTDIITETSINARLPKDIRIIKAEKVSEKFHARYSAKSKNYQYTILNERVDDPFLYNYYYKVHHKLNFAAMKREAKRLIGRHDFRAFQAKSNLSSIKNTVRTIKTLNIQHKDNFVIITIEANGFLHNMVRNIVGTLIEIGRGYLPEGSMKKILRSRDRKVAGPTAPAKGLTLIRVQY